MNVFAEFGKIASRLKLEENLPYALVGGIAVAFHGHFRYTKDIDVLVTSESLGRVSQLLKSTGYIEKAVPWTFSDSQIRLHRFVRFEGEDHMMIDVMVGLTEKHREIIEKAIDAEMDNGMVRVVTLEDLIWMKLQRNSALDQDDIKELRNAQDGSRPSGTQPTL